MLPQGGGPHMPFARAPPKCGGGEACNPAPASPSFDTWQCSYPFATMIETSKQLPRGAMASAEDHDSAMDARVAALVEQWWREHETPMLLSRLGAEDDGAVARDAKARAGGLTAYLQQQLADKVRVLQPSFNPLLRGAIPASVKEEDIDVDASFEQCGERASPRLPGFLGGVPEAAR